MSSMHNQDSPSTMHTQDKPPFLKSNYGLAGLAFVILFGLTALGIAVYRAIIVGSIVANVIGMRTWPEARATLQRVELHERRGHKGTVYRVSAEYAYFFAGRSYQGRRVSLYPDGDNFGSFQKDVYSDLDRKRRMGAPVPCYVDPKNPPSSILIRDLRPAMSALEMVFVLVFGTLGGLTLYGLVDLWRRRNQAQAQ